MSATSSRYAPAEKMTLRRFVRVTYDNFRQLIQTIATPVVLPMPVLTTQPSPTDAEPANGKASVPQTTAVDELAEGELAEGELAGSELAMLAEDGMAGALAENLTADEAGPTAPASPETVNPAQGGSDDDMRADGLVDGASAEASPPADPPLLHTEDAHPAEALEIVEAAPPVSAGQWPLLAGGQALTLAGALESLLFVTDDPAEPVRLARVLGVEPGVIEAALQELDADYRRQGRGLRLQVRAGRYQIVTAPEAANLIEAYLNLDTSTKLSAPALETLAVIAYRQPVTRAQIEAVRGVDCSGVLRSLIQRGLVEEVGRVDAPGRPVLYGITDLFMHHFGLTALHELPPLESAELERIDEALSLDPVLGGADGLSVAAGSAPSAGPGPA